MIAIERLASERVPLVGKYEKLIFYCSKYFALNGKLVTRSE